MKYAESSLMLWFLNKMVLSTEGQVFFSICVIYKECIETILYIISVDGIRHDVIVTERSAGHLFGLKHLCFIHLSGFFRISATSY